MTEVTLPVVKGLAYVNRLQDRKMAHILKAKDGNWYQAIKVGEANDLKFDVLTCSVTFNTEYELEDGFRYVASVQEVVGYFGLKPYKIDISVYPIETYDDSKEGSNGRVHAGRDQ